MAKTYLGIDIGHDQLKLALVKGKKVIRTAVAEMPEHMLQEGRVVSIEAMADLLRTTMRENGMHCNKAALVLNGESVYVKNIVMPIMNVDQLKINLPFEFKDYIVDELKNYTYDYAMISTPGELREILAQGDTDPSIERRMELTGAAVPKQLLAEYELMLRRAGLKLVKAAPVCSAYSALIRAAIEKTNASKMEYGLIDLGASAIRMHIFDDDRYNVVRELDNGLKAVEEAISETQNVDIHLAHTYLKSNYEHCQENEVCGQCFENISVGLVRAMNFYRFSNPDSQLADIWITGGGANIPALCKSIENAMDVKVHTVDELLPGKKMPEDANMMLPAIGIAMS